MQARAVTEVQNLSPDAASCAPRAQENFTAGRKDPNLYISRGGGNPQQKFYRTLTRCNKPYKTTGFDKQMRDLTGGENLRQKFYRTFERHLTGGSWRALPEFRELSSQSSDFRGLSQEHDPWLKEHVGNYRDICVEHVQKLGDQSWEHDLGFSVANLLLSSQDFNACSSRASGIGRQIPTSQGAI